jgi:hypothetical protein
MHGDTLALTLGGSENSEGGFHEDRLADVDRHRQWHGGLDGHRFRVINVYDDLNRATTVSEIPSL